MKKLKNDSKFIDNPYNLKVNMLYFVENFVEENTKFGINQKVKDIMIIEKIFDRKIQGKTLKYCNDHTKTAGDLGDHWNIGFGDVGAEKILTNQSPGTFVFYEMGPKEKYPEYLI